MRFLDLAVQRISVRGFAPDPVSEKDLMDVLEAGRMAPSAANRQPWHFVVVRDPRTRLALREAYDREWFWQAPVIIVVCVNPSVAWVRSDGRNYATVDGAIAMDHMTLCATDIGLGTCWVAAADPVRIRAILGVPENLEVVAMTPLGKPVDGGRAKVRKDLRDMLHMERW